MRYSLENLWIKYLLVLEFKITNEGISSHHIHRVAPHVPSQWFVANCINIFPYLIVIPYLFFRFSVTFFCPLNELQRWEKCLQIKHIWHTHTQTFELYDCGQTMGGGGRPPWSFSGALMANGPTLLPDLVRQNTVHVFPIKLNLLASALRIS